MTRARNLTQTSQQDCRCKLLRQNLKPGDSFRCSDCNEDIQGVSNGTSDEEEEANAESSGRKVQEIFARIASRSQRQLVSKEENPLLTAARGEALSSFSGNNKAAGYQKLARGPSPFVGAQRGRKGTLSSSQPSKSQPSRSQMSGTTFRISSVGMLTDGVRKAGILRTSRVPGSKDLMKMKNRGCYSDEGFSLNSGWTTAEVEAEVQRWFPGVWTFIRSHGLHEQVDESGHILPWFRLLTRNNYTLSVVEIRFPTGRDLHQHKGRDKAGVADSRLWFVTRNRVPDGVYESWNTQPVIAGSDSELDDCTTTLDPVENVTEPEDEDDDIYDKLSSSFTGLDLKTSQTQHTDMKGKNKAPLQTPHKPRKKRQHAMLSPTSSSPSNGTQVAMKKIKDATARAIPLFQPVLEAGSSSEPAANGGGSTQSMKLDIFSTIPTRMTHTFSHVSPAPAFVAISQSDIWLRKRVPSDDPSAPAVINAWDHNYMIERSFDLHSLLSVHPLTS